MAERHATFTGPLAETAGSVRRAATRQGWDYAEGESTPDLLVFRKGTSLFSWGSRIEVRLSPSEAGTGAHLSTTETFALTDWGRGTRAIIHLVEGAGGTVI